MQWRLLHPGNVIDKAYTPIHFGVYTDYDLTDAFG